MHISRILAVLGACALVNTHPLADGTERASKELDKRFYYTNYEDKRDAGDEKLGKRFYYTNYDAKRAKRDVGDENLGKKFYYTNYDEKREE
ncbi:hypothetical protein BBO_08289 [Beauveria brongniartii RCEF 3172]|uniref:Uncharacterized protein n=1 Tax=Beauveria brongniartii RCEF 3172 TaxID=1081107 RepID=A0A166XS21_9HYPO|nr:hypothetical protein BBO_08289 [Beauveria brongniartii RCEF 3172]